MPFRHQKRYHGNFRDSPDYIITIVEEDSETVNVRSLTTNAINEIMGTWQIGPEAGVPRGAEFLKRDEFGFKGCWKGRNGKSWRVEMIFFFYSLSKFSFGCGYLQTFSFWVIQVWSSDFRGLQFSEGCRHWPPAKPIGWARGRVLFKPGRMM